MAMKKVLEYLKEKGIEIDESLLKYVEKGVDITDEDEFHHDFGIGNYPEHHNESWYFNFLDFNSNVHMIARTSFEMGRKISNILLLFVVDRKMETHINRLDIGGFPKKKGIYGDKKIKCECLEPMKKWRITFTHRKFDVDVLCEGRFPVFNYLSHEDPLESLKKYGVEMLDVAAQQHYEQGMKVSGVVKLKKKGEVVEERKIDCYGHRDHSWGTRDWINIEKWNWICCQFDDSTINCARIEVFGKVIQTGFISTAKGNEHITDVEVTTERGVNDDKRAPRSSTFKLSTANRQFTVVSNTWKSTRLALPSEKGVTEVYEQIVEWEMDGKKGTGISEYMTSIKKDSA